MEHIETPEMHSAPIVAAATSRLAFSDRFEQLTARSPITSAEITVPSEAELLAALAAVAETFPVIDAAAVLPVYRHNPECFRVVWRGSFAASPMMTYLPMNAEGTAALIDGRFDPRAPDLRFVCRPGERPDSLYLWLMFTPGRMVAGLRLIREMERYGRGVTIFTRPAHEESARILAMAGFVPAHEFFPAASEDLLFTLSNVVKPGGRADRKAATVRVVRTFEDMAKIFSVRTATYMTEQLCSYDEEFDGNDFSGTHLLGEMNGEPAGCVRIRYFGEFAKIERLAVRPEFRRSRLMRELARFALDFCARKGFRKVYGHVRHDLVPAWEKMFGAYPLESRPVFSFSDVEYREMVFDLPSHEAAVHIGSDPLLTIRPEGEWDRLGPIEKAQFMKSDGRKERIGELRQFAG